MFGIGLGLGIGKRIQKLLNAFYLLYKTRVLADSGTVEDQSYANKIFNFLEDNSLLSATKLLISPWMGVKERTSSIYTFFTKLFSADATPNDASQTTELNQLYKSGNIAPNEVACALCPNGDLRYFDHNPITYADNEAWTITTFFNWNNGNEDNLGLWGHTATTSYLVIKSAGNNRYLFVPTVGSSSTGNPNGTNILIGKNKILSVIADGLGGLFIYVDGSLVESFTGVATGITVSRVMIAMSITRQFEGKLHLHHIISQNITALIPSYHAFLRTLIPEIESVQIGSQEWATSNLDIACTPEGNVIKEVQLASDTEKLINGDFATGDTSGWSESGPPTTFEVVDYLGRTNTAHVICSLANQGILQSVIGSGKWYYVDFYLNVISGSVYCGKSDNKFTGNNLSPAIWTRYNGYFKSGDGSWRIYSGASSTEYYVDTNIVEEVAWAGLGDLYTWLIDPAGGNYSEYDALKECAAWCYYDNDTANGAVYGKLYNWYAAFLINTDMGTAAFGWHVPTEAEFNTLATALGGASVAGGKMKKEGTDYWNTPNTGADNSSGFTALPGGSRHHTLGSFSDINDFCIMWASNPYIALLSKLNDDVLVISRSTSEKNTGYLIRLIAN